MDLRQKQMNDKNKGGCLACEFVSASVLLITLVGYANGITGMLLFRTIVCIAVMIVSAVFYRFMKNDFAYRHVCGASMILVYVVTLATSTINGMYAVAYAIAIMVMLFGDRFFVTAGATIAVIGILVRVIVSGVQGTITVTDAVIEVLFLSVACCLAIIVVRTQIKHTNETIEAIQAGAEVQVRTSEDVVKLAGELNQKFVHAKEVADTLNETMDTTHNSVNEIAESSKMTAESVEQQTMQTSDIQQSIQKVGQEAGNIGEISDRTNRTVEEGVLLIEQLKQQASEVAKISMETKTTTEALNESIKDVQEITETILGISNQTNLLALNASIEAARAGEAGKGFAVVADEIRTLSESTRQATEQISAIITRLTQDAQLAANSMMQSADYAQKQNELIEQTGGKLGDIKVETDELHEGVLQVNASVQNIIAANTIIVDSISNLSAQSEEVAASTETVLAVSDSSMEALADMNDVLHEISEISRQMEIVAKQ